MPESSAQFVLIGGTIGIIFSLMYSLMSEKRFDASGNLWFDSNSGIIRYIGLVAPVASIGFSLAASIVYFTSFEDGSDWRHTNCSDLSDHGTMSMYSGGRLPHDSTQLNPMEYAPHRSTEAVKEHDAALMDMNLAAGLTLGGSLLAAIVAIIKHSPLNEEGGKGTDNKDMSKKLIFSFLDLVASGLVGASFYFFARVISRPGSTIDGVCSLQIVPANMTKYQDIFAEHGMTKGFEEMYGDFSTSSENVGILLLSINYGLIFAHAIIRPPTAFHSSTIEG